MEFSKLVSEGWQLAEVTQVLSTSQKLMQGNGLTKEDYEFLSYNVGRSPEAIRLLLENIPQSVERGSITEDEFSATVTLWKSKVGVDQENVEHKQRDSNLQDPKAADSHIKRKFAKVKFANEKGDIESAKHPYKKPKKIATDEQVDHITVAQVEAVMEAKRVKQEAIKTRLRVEKLEAKRQHDVKQSQTANWKRPA